MEKNRRMTTWQSLIYKQQATASRFIDSVFCCLLCRTKSENVTVLPQLAVTANMTLLHVCIHVIYFNQSRVWWISQFVFDTYWLIYVVDTLYPSPVYTFHLLFSCSAYRRQLLFPYPQSFANTTIMFCVTCIKAPGAFLEDTRTRLLRQVIC